MLRRLTQKYEIQEYIMKRVAAVIIATLITLFGIMQVSAASGGVGHRALQVRAGKAGPITIQTWLHAQPDKNGLSGTVMACFKLEGTFRGQGGDPNWTNSTYSDTTHVSPANKCGDWYPVGGFLFEQGSKQRTRPSMPCTRSPLSKGSFSLPIPAPTTCSTPSRAVERG